MKTFDYYVNGTILQLHILHTGLLIRSASFAGTFDMKDFKGHVKSIASTFGIKLITCVESGTTFKGYMYTTNLQELKHSFLRKL